MTFEHQGLLFRRRRRLHEVARERLRGAVRGGDHTVLAVADPAALLDGLTPEDRGRVLVMDRDALYDAPGRALATLHRMTSVHDSVTVVAQPPMPFATALESREWHRWESVLCTALAPTRMRLLCVHDERGLPPGTRSTVLATHPVLVEESGGRPNPAYLGATVLGRRRRAPEPLRLHGPEHLLEIGQSLPRLRADLTALARDLDLPEDRAEGLVVAANELAANVLEHGAGKGTVRIRRGHDRWVCDVFDERGGLTDPLAGYRPADGLRTRGYGLWITRQICDHMEICADEEGSLVRLHFVDRAPDRATEEDGEGRRSASVGP
ncbi:anti-sigma factor RsbA family regulatory protein [Nocardiopsis sp. MG754419]|uniref:anti-sigma factor RsbA family regulatory protein n=1 Tax=Nocardiopsis sp. MG754419 TaxID=2259865 RepID=UPI001BABFE98|nr:anti-sigma factor RsbA family regulatory protein [Nocardiopsis sp. MG754419]MBR8740568.1 sensor histidine kinase [Nocardiopsis sp. MG754419]